MKNVFLAHTNFGRLALRLPLWVRNKGDDAKDIVARIERHANAGFGAWSTKRSTRLGVADPVRREAFLSLRNC